MKTIITAILLLLIVSCESKYKNEADSISELTIQSLNKEEQIPEGEGQNFFNPGTDSTGGQVKKSGDKKIPDGDPVAKPDWDKKIIKNATLNLEIKDYKAYSILVRDKIKNLGGYIAQEEQTQTDYKIQNTISIKVPVDQFETAVTELTQNVELLNEKKISSQDVSTEYVDVKSRLESRKQARLKYLDFLKQAKNMEEILNVQKEINSIQEEIESAAGRVQYLSHSSAFSTISLVYAQVLNPSAKDNKGPGFGAKLLAAFRSGANWLLDLLIEIVALWPLFLIIIGAIIYFKKIRKTTIKQPVA